MSGSGAAEAWTGAAEPSPFETQTPFAGCSQRGSDTRAGVETGNAPSQAKVESSSPHEPPREGLEGVDPAIADALKAPKNRATVLRFEEDVLAFIESGDEAMHFPLSLSGYQRLLAHRTAQYHGLQTATVDDSGDEHGKIKATKPQPQIDPRPKLADIKVPEPPPEQKEPPKAKKRGSERQSRKGRESSAGDGGRESQRVYLERAQEQRRAQERMMGMAGFPFPGTFGPMLPPTYPPRPAYSAFPATSFGTPPSEGIKGAPKADDQRMDVASNRSRSFSSSTDEELRRRLSLTNSAPEEPFSGPPSEVEHQMSGLSLQPQVEQHGMMHPGMAMPGYGAIPVPFAYVPTAAGIPQPMTHLPGMGMYGSTQIPYTGYPAQMPYGYVPGRPQMVSAMLGQPIAHPGMVPYYPGYVPPGYAVPGMTPPVPIQQQSAAASQSQSRGSAGLSPGTPGMSRRTSSVAERAHRQDHGSPTSSTSRSHRRGLASHASLESDSGEAPSP